MNKETAIKKAIQQQLKKARDRLTGYRVVIFGSRATGKAKPRSDFDIGVVGPEPLPLKTFYYIEDLLDAIDTLYTIDWVDLNRVSPQFKQEALKATEVLYEG